MLDFDGETFDPVQDRIRLNRQSRNVFNLMKDEKWRTLTELSETLRAPTTSISARLRDMRKKRFGSHTVNRRRVHGGVFEYQLVENPEA